MRRRVDAGPGAGYTAGIRALYHCIAVIATLFTLATGACATRGAPIQVQGPASPEFERDAAATTAPDRPLRILFDWSVRERDARFRGRGAARIQDPYRARLDLFGPRGEGYLSAALVEDELRLPPSTAATQVPPPTLLWSVLGVFRPPVGAALIGTQRDGDRTRLEYADGQDRWRFEFVAGAVRRAEWIRSGGARQTVEIEGTDEHGVPRQAVYRDYAAFTELTLTLDEVEQVDAFSPEVWTPGAE